MPFGPWRKLVVERSVMQSGDLHNMYFAKRGSERGVGEQLLMGRAKIHSNLLPDEFARHKRGEMVRSFVTRYWRMPDVPCPSLPAGRDTPEDGTSS